ncbi:MAG: cell division protein FtsA, cell division protein FtsA [Candidatus Parcubacteria bacterium]|jgi:cell division protein FtsA
MKILTGLDIGTSSVRAVVVENRGGKPLLRGAFREPSAGLKKGAIHDLAEATSAVGKVLHEAKRVHHSALKTVYVNIGTSQVKTQPSRGIVAVSRTDSEIYQDDIDRVEKASVQAVPLSPNRTVVHNITREFIVDGVGDIIDPLGLSGSRLEVSSVIVDAFAPHVKAIIRVVELAGGHIGGIIVNPLAAGRATLSKSQKELGVVLIDIGTGTTGIAIYEEQKLVNMSVFPVGAGNVTNDVAIRLKIPVAAAENLKLNYGYAIASDINIRENIDIEKFAPEMHGMISRRLVAETMEVRLAEIMDLVNTELKLSGKVGRLAGGAVFVGGGSKLPGLTELARSELRLSTQIGCTSRDGWVVESDEFTDTFEDPEFAVALGLAMTGTEKEGWPADASPGLHKKLLRYFLP